jgi:predicted ATP-dependent Lon-type protease
MMKGYMESGEFSRGKESIRADGSIVLVGNFEVDVDHQQRVGHLFGPMPEEMKDDTAFMDRIHSFLPGWDVPKINKELLTNHFGLVNDFLSECWSQLRNQSRVSLLQNRVFFGGALSGRDTNAVNKTISGLLKLIYPGSGNDIPDEDLEWAVRIAMEARRCVKEQQKRIGAAEFRNTHFSYVMGADGVENSSPPQNCRATTASVVIHLSQARSGVSVREAAKNTLGSIALRLMKAQALVSKFSTSPCRPPSEKAWDTLNRIYTLARCNWLATKTLVTMSLPPSSVLLMLRSQEQSWGWPHW